jgi:hypothetical protein
MERAELPHSERCHPAVRQLAALADLVGAGPEQAIGRSIEGGARSTFSLESERGAAAALISSLRMRRMRLLLVLVLALG